MYAVLQSNDMLRINALQLEPGRHSLQLGPEFQEKDRHQVFPEDRRLALHSLKLALSGKYEEDRGFLLQRLMADYTADDPSKVEDGVLCSEVLARMRLIQKWEGQRFMFQRRLPWTRQPARQIELYVDGLDGRAVVAKRVTFDQIKCRLRADETWPEVVITKRLVERRRGDRGHVACPSYDAFYDDRGDVLLVTDYIPGGDLLEFTRSLTEPGPARERKAWPVILALLRAVLRLHTSGIAHCNISLENAMQWPEPHGVEVVLINFKLAVMGGRCIKTGVCGERPYQAPEMWGLQAWDTYAADFFACGVAAYCLAVGSYPWETTKPDTCHRFAFFAEHGLPAFLQEQRVTVGGIAGWRPVSECISTRLSRLLDVLLSLSPSMRQVATVFLP